MKVPRVAERLSMVRACVAMMAKSAAQEGQEEVGTGEGERRNPRVEAAWQAQQRKMRAK